MPPETLAALPHVAPDALAAMLDPARTALLVIDIQNDFAAPDGFAGGAGLDLSSVPPAIDKIELILEAARGAGVGVAVARVVTRVESDPTALKLLMARKGRPGAEAICREDSSGADFFRLRPHQGDISVEKVLFSCFHQTDLDARLRARGVDTLVVTGMTTDCCVDCTARDAFHRNYNVFVVSDATCAYDPDLHLGALRGLQKNCALLVDCAAVLQAWAPL